LRFPNGALTNSPGRRIIPRGFIQEFKRMRNYDSAAITLRPADANDEAFLYRLYASSRAAELAAWGWDSAQQEAFLNLQFRAQQAHYAEYPNVNHQIVLAGERPVGRLLVSELDDEFRLVDITLLAEHCDAGIGAALIDQLLDRARLSGKAVRLHVEKANRAQRLYRRLGFAEIGDAGSHFFMEWRASEG
jgi:ribosomal protein S18 acetylase RimI-like enzyme